MDIKELVQSLVQREFDQLETLAILRAYPIITMSWGVHALVKAGNKGILFNVNGHHHKGYVLITLAWDDTYTVNLITKNCEVVKTFTNVYFDMLVETIDEAIERVPEYRF